MKLSQLLSIYPQLKWGENPAREVTSLCMDSRAAEPGCVYIAITGHSADGHRFIPQVVNAGAIGLVVESEKHIPADYKGAVVTVNDTRAAINHLASRFYNEPAQRLFCVGVTGTNGKTTITHMVEAVLQKFGWKTGVMGTIDHHLGDRVWPSQLTTPDALTLHKRLQEFETLGAKAVAFEVSSHALSQKRADHIPFDAVVFSNLTRDHLDYHKTFEEYFAAKERLFREIPQNSGPKTVTAVINSDDPWGQKIRVADRARVWTYGQHDGDFKFSIRRQDFTGSVVNVITPRGEKEFHLPMPGLHNVQNAVAALAVGVAAGASLETGAEALSHFAGVRGRLQRVTNEKGLHVFVDYAHTDDALKSVLSALDVVRRSTGTKNRFITVFGCGGDRDKGKRPLMAQAALAGSDLVIVTSDNPRGEDPQSIVGDILAGVPKADLNRRLFVEIDRQQAIAKALQMAERDDVVLIAGKGHETYQMINGQSLPFDDVAVAKELLN